MNEFCRFCDASLHTRLREFIFDTQDAYCQQRAITLPEQLTPEWVRERLAHEAEQRYILLSRLRGLLATPAVPTEAASVQQPAAFEGPPSGFTLDMFKKIFSGLGPMPNQAPAAPAAPAPVVSGASGPADTNASAMEDALVPPDAADAHEIEEEPSGFGHSVEADLSGFGTVLGEG